MEGERDKVEVAIRSGSAWLEGDLGVTCLLGDGMSQVEGDQVSS